MVNILTTAFLILAIIAISMFIIGRIRWRIKNYLEEKQYKKERKAQEDKYLSDERERMWRNIGDTERNVWKLNDAINEIKEILTKKEDKKNVKKKKRN